MPTNLSKYGTKEAPNTAVITRRDGSKEYVKNNKVVREFDSRGTPIIRVELRRRKPSGGSGIASQIQKTQIQVAKSKAINKLQTAKTTKDAQSALNRLSQLDYARATLEAQRFNQKQKQKLIQIRNQPVSKVKTESKLFLGKNGSRILSGTILEPLFRKKVKQTGPRKTVKEGIQVFEQRIKTVGKPLTEPTKRKKIEIEKQKKAIDKISAIYTVLNNMEKEHEGVVNIFLDGFGLKERGKKTRIARKTVNKIFLFINPIAVGMSIGGNLAVLREAQKSGLVNINKIISKGAKLTKTSAVSLARDIRKGDKQAILRRIDTSKKLLRSLGRLAKTEEGFSTILALAIATGIGPKLLAKGLKVTVKGTKITFKVSKTLIKEINRTGKGILRSKAGKLRLRGMTKRQTREFIKLLRKQGKLKPMTLREAVQRGAIKARAKVIVSKKGVNEVKGIKLFKKIKDPKTGKTINIVKKGNKYYKEVPKSVNAGTKQKVIVIQLVELKPQQLKVLLKPKIKTKPKLKVAQKQKQLQKQKLKLKLLRKPKQKVIAIQKLKATPKQKTLLVAVSRVKQKPKLKVAQKQKQLQKQIQKITQIPKQKQTTQQKQKLKLLQLMKQDLRLKFKLAQIPKQKLIQKTAQKKLQAIEQVQEQIQVLRQRLKTIQKPKTRLRIKQKPRRKIKFKLLRPRKKKIVRNLAKNIIKKIPSKYRPSLLGIFNELETEEIPDFISGIEIRPILVRIINKLSRKKRLKVSRKAKTPVKRVKTRVKRKLPKKAKKRKK